MKHNQPRDAMNPPPDHAQRQRALDASQSFIVQAPAGSGKTELLVRRYLALLATVDAPEQILAITFTKKATAEMRLRIGNALRRIQENGQPEDNPELLAIADAALANDARHGWDIAANPRRLRIQTIDAFCNELVRCMPWSARFGAPPDIVDDPAPLYRQAAQHTLDHLDAPNSEYADACQHLLELVDADWNRAQSLLADLLGKRDRWLPLLGPADRAHLEGMWAQVVDTELQRVAAMLPVELQAALAKLGALAAENLQDAANLRDAADLRDSSTPSRLLALQDGTFPEADHHHIAKWYGIADLLLTGGGELRKTVTVKQGFPAKTDGKAQMLELLGSLAGERGRGGLAEALDGVRRLPGGGFSDPQWRSIDALTGLLPVAAAELQLLFTAHNQADYIELTRRATLALGDASGPSDLALAFDYHIAHLLMDEFQDTSSAHIDLLTKLTAGWQGGDGRTLFVVGDPMQSIYRFREAEVANFLQVQQAGLGDIRPQPIVLESNFRSAPELVAWFNYTFRALLPAEDDMVNGAVSYTSASASAHAANPQGRVHIHAGIDHTNPEEAERVADLIREAQQQDPDQSIAVLGRARGHLHGIAAALRLRGIAFQGVDLEKLADRPAIRDLTALTRALAQPTDRIAWLSLLRAPWCGLSLEDLTTLAGEDHAATLVELQRDGRRMAALSEQGRARLGRLMDCLAAALHDAGRIGIRHNVESAWLRLGGPAVVETSELQDCQRYLDLIDELEAKRIEITADNLRDATDHLWAGSGADARVQLLTIHRAKGLEFDRVFVPGLGRSPGSADAALLRWRKLPRQLLMAPLPSSTAKDDAFYAYLAHLEKIHAHNELGRLLYVACTRARKHLHLFGGAKSNGGNEGLREPPARSLLALLWPRVRDEYAEAARAGGADDGASGADTSGGGRDTRESDGFRPQSVRRLPGDWQPPALPPDIFAQTSAVGATHQTVPIEFSWATETARVTGIVIHQILQRVDDTGWEKWRREPLDETQKTRWRNLLRENGMYGEPLEAALGRVVEAIQKTRADERAAWLFSGEHQRIKTEWPLSGVVDGTIRHFIIDRSFIDNSGVRWIVDFKSGLHAGAGVEAFLNQEQQRHRQKMAQYAELVGNLQPGKINLGLYFPALQGWREWRG